MIAVLITLVAIFVIMDRSTAQARLAERARAEREANK